MAVGNTWFIRWRARAMTVISSAVPIGGTLITPLFAHGRAILGLALGRDPCWNAFLSHRYPAWLRRAAFARKAWAFCPTATRRNAVASARPETRLAATQPSAREDPTLREAMKTLVFWLFVIGMTVRVGAYSTITVHFVPIMVWKGLTQESAAFLLAASRF